jgi:hypothetical protein
MFRFAPIDIPPTSAKPKTQNVHVVRRKIGSHYLSVVVDAIGRASSQTHDAVNAILVQEAMRPGVVEERPDNLTQIVDTGRAGRVCAGNAEQC